MVFGIIIVNFFDLAIKVFWIAFFGSRAYN